MSSSTNSKSKHLRKEKVYKSFVLQKPLSRKKTDFKSAAKILGASLRFFRQHIRYFSLLSLVFLVLAFLFFLSAEPVLDLKQLQTDLRLRYGDGWSAEVYTTLNLLPELINLLGRRIAQTLGLFIILNFLISLSLWWLIRNLQEFKEGVKIKVREAIYFGPAQVVPFIIVISILFIQLLPVLVAVDFSTQLRDNEILQSNWEQLVALLVLGGVFVLSFYWIIGGIFSPIIASLPGVKPLKAWQTSMHLTHRRRLPLALRLLFMVTLFIFASCLLILPFLWLLPQWADYLFYLIGLYFFMVGHIYCFLLYQDSLTAKVV